MSTPEDAESSSSHIRIVRGRVDSLALYEVTDSELRTLERGSPGTIYMSFSIFLLTVSLSFLVSILSTTIEPLRTYIAFLAVVLLSGISGLILLVLWWRNRESIKEVIYEIKLRIPNSEIVKVLHDSADS